MLETYAFAGALTELSLLRLFNAYHNETDVIDAFNVGLAGGVLGGLASFHMGGSFLGGVATVPRVLLMSVLGTVLFNYLLFVTHP